MVHTDWEAEKGVKEKDDSRKGKENKEEETHTISTERPDSWDDYCVSNALNFFGETEI